MTQIRQSIAWWCFVPQKMTPEALLRAAAEIGYEAIEQAPTEYWPLIKEYGLKVGIYKGHLSIEDGMNRRENRTRIQNELRANLELAAKWGITNLICFSGNRNGTDDAEGAEITAETLRSVAKAAEDAGVTLALELLNSKVDHIGYQCDHTEWGLKVCQMVDSPRVKLLYDIYHMQIMEGDVIRTIQQHHPYFAYYHTAGNPGRHELNESQELNYRPIMQAIAATGYDGYIGQEFVPTGDPTAALKAAFDICNIG